MRNCKSACDKPFLLHPAQFLDCGLAPAGGGAGFGGLAVHQGDGTARAGVARAEVAAAVVFGEAAFEVGGDAGIESAVGAAQDVDVPGRHGGLNGIGADTTIRRSA